MVRSVTAVIVTLTVMLPAAASAQQVDDRSSNVVERTVDQRPGSLPLLYASFAALQIYDAYATVTGVREGAREANPAMQWIGQSPARIWTIKAATTTLGILASERLWKHNKTAAIVTMTLLNGMAVTVAAHNASTLGRIR